MSRQAGRLVRSLLALEHGEHISRRLLPHADTPQTLKYNPATWRVPYDHVVFKDQRQVLVTYCLQLLLVLILYPIPESGNGPAPKNFFRHFLGRLHRPQDFQFLVDGMTRILNQPACLIFDTTLRLLTDGSSKPTPRTYPAATSH